MKIGFVLDDSLDKPDGVQQYITTLGAYYTSIGHDIHYLVGTTLHPEIKNVHSLARTVTVKFNHNRVGTPLPVSRRKLSAFLRKQQFDVLHVQMPYSPLFAARVIKAAPPHTAIVGTFHIIPFSRFESTATRLLSTLLRSSIKRFDTVVSVSSVAQAFCKQSFGLQSEVIPNVVNIKQLSTGQPTYRDDQKVSLVFLGRLVERKGAAQLLQAVEALRTDTPFQLFICGKGPLDATLREYVTKQGLGERVQFVGFVSDSEKADYLSSADIAIFPSTGGESFGIVLIEAMAAGSTSVIAGDNPGYRSVIGERPQQLVDPMDIAAFSNKLQEYIDNPELRDEAHSWQTSYVQRFDVVEVGERLLRVYSEAIANKPNNDDN